MKEKNMKIEKKTFNKILDKINIHLYQEHIIEQIILRIYVCKNCLFEKKCKFCNCNPLDKIIEPKSCNKVAPDFMSKEKWIIFKSTHNIEII